MRKTAAFVLMALGFPMGAMAQASPPAADAASMQQLDALQKAVTDAWERMPLTARRAIFVTARPPNYGAWVQRPSNVFKPGEKLLTYVEPVGYTWKPSGDGFNFGLVADLIVKSSDGKTLANQQGFLKADFSSHTKMQEVMVTMTVSLDGIAPGNYVLEYQLHDAFSEKAATVALPFTMAP